MPKHPAGVGDSGCRVFVLLCNILTVTQKNHAPMLEPSQHVPECSLRHHSFLVERKCSKEGWQA